MASVKHDNLSYPQLYDKLEELNTSCFDFILNEDFNGFEETVTTFIESGITELENFDTARRMYRYVNIPTIINGSYWGKLGDTLFQDYYYKYWGHPQNFHDIKQKEIKPQFLKLTDLKDYEAKYGCNEYEHEPAGVMPGEKAPTIININKRVAAIKSYIGLYKDLYKYGSKSSPIHNVEKYQEPYITKLKEMVALRKKFFLTYNFELFDEAEKFNNSLNGLSRNDKLEILETVVTNVYNNQEVTYKNIRNYIKFEDKTGVTFSNYLQGKMIDRKNWKNYYNYKFPKNMMFYLELAFYLVIPSSKEIEKFLNFHGYSINSDFLLFQTIPIGKKNHNIMLSDLKRWIDAGIDYELINEILGYQLEKKEVRKPKNKSK